MRPTITRLITAVAGLVLAAPLMVEAQARPIPRIGILTTGAVGTDAPIVAPFREALRELGHIEGQNIALEIRSANGKPERLSELAAELVQLKVSVLVAVSNPAVAAAHTATTSIPIVMTNATDPVAAGFVAALARPGGNITGLTIQSPDVAGKALQLLWEAVPDLSRVAVFWDPGFPGGRQYLTETETAAQALGVRLQLVEVRSPDEVDGAFAAATRHRAQGVFVAGSPVIFAGRTRIAKLGVRRGLPTMCPLREFVEAGCLLGYGASLSDQHSRAAYFVDRILKGAKPADLPIEQPTKFYFAINLKTARALGFSIPRTVLLRADQVIE